MNNHNTIIISPFHCFKDSKEECVDYEYYATESKRNPNDNKDRRQLSTENPK